VRKTRAVHGANPDVRSDGLGYFFEGAGTAVTMTQPTIARSLTDASTRAAGEQVREPAAEIRYRGDVEVRPFRRGTYLGREHLETMIEGALGSRYQFGGGWKGFAVVSILLYEGPPPGEGDEKATA
jgi:hypothetical protein